MRVSLPLMASAPSAISHRVHAKVVVSSSPSPSELACCTHPALLYSSEMSTRSTSSNASTSHPNTTCLCLISSVGSENTISRTSSSSSSSHTPSTPHRGKAQAHAAVG